MAISVIVPGRLAFGTNLYGDVRSIKQRNWSRVSEGPVLDSSGRELFLKQFVGADGSLRKAEFFSEITSARLAKKLCETAQIEVAQPLYVDEENYVLGYKYDPLLTSDEILRANAIDLHRLWPDIMSLLLDLKTELRDRSTSLLSSDQDQKITPVVAFKGLELRNVGVRISNNEVIGLKLFDLGAASIQPLEVVMGRLVASAYLLHWGRPLRMFAKGPGSWFGPSAQDAFRDWTGPSEIVEDLHQEFQERINQTQGSNVLERSSKRTFLWPLGSSYLRKCIREVDRHA